VLARSDWTWPVEACIQPHSPRTGVSRQTRRGSENLSCSAAADPVQRGRRPCGRAAATERASGPARSYSTMSIRLATGSTVAVGVNPLRSMTALTSWSPVWISRRSQVRRGDHAARRRTSAGKAAKKRIRSTGGRHHAKVTSVTLARRSPSAWSNPARPATASSGSSSSDRSGPSEQAGRARPNGRDISRATPAGSSAVAPSDRTRAGRLRPPWLPRHASCDPSIPPPRHARRVLAVGGPSTKTLAPETPARQRRRSRSPTALRPLAILCLPVRFMASFRSSTCTSELELPVLRLAREAGAGSRRAAGRGRLDPVL